MEAICSLLPGADQPILSSEYSGDEYDEEDSVDFDEDATSESDDNFNKSVVSADTNGDISLPQPPKEFMKPLTVECDPVSCLFDLHI